MSVSVVVPAFNEENTISGVIDVLERAGDVGEIIVVSDGSSDGTVTVSQNCGAKVIELRENMGKGAAIKKGLEVCKGDVVLLLDADLVGLRPAHIKNLLEPVVDGGFDMTIGVFSSGRLVTDIAQKVAPHLSGQRAVRKTILEELMDFDINGYAIETALTRYARRKNARVKIVELEDLTHIMKEEKLGFLKGFTQRLKMYWQILKSLKLAK